MAKPKTSVSAKPKKAGLDSVQLRSAILKSTPLIPHGWTLTYEQDLVRDRVHLILSGAGGSTTLEVTFEVIHQMQSGRFPLEEIGRQFTERVVELNLDALREEFDVLHATEIQELYFRESDKAMKGRMETYGVGLDPLQPSGGLIHPAHVFEGDERKMVETFQEKVMSKGAPHKETPFAWVQGFGEVGEDVLYGVPVRMESVINTIQRQMEMDKFMEDTWKAGGPVAGSVADYVKIDRETGVKL